MFYVLNFIVGLVVIYGFNSYPISDACSYRVAWKVSRPKYLS